MNDDKKISLPAIIIFVMINGWADILDIIAVIAFAIPVIGQINYFLSLLMGFFAFAITQGYLIMKGGIGFKKQATYLVGALLDFIPFLSALPTRTITFLVTVYLVNNPKVVAVGREIAGTGGQLGSAEQRSPSGVEPKEAA